MSSINYREDQELFSVLEMASQEDLGVLIDIITDNGKGRVALDDGVMSALLAAKNAGAVQNMHLLMIAGEIQLFGGNSIINLFRGKGVAYREIICDVADHLKANFYDNQDVAVIESDILMKVLEKSLEQMSEEEKKNFFAEFGVNYSVGAGAAAIAAMQAVIRTNGFMAYKLAVIAANAVAKAVIGRGLILGTNAAITRTVGAFAGPIGWAITAIWSAFDLAAPAYRVTVPCTIQLAYMRQTAMMKKLPQCQNCLAPNDGDAVFCNKCGHKFSS